MSQLGKELRCTSQSTDEDRLSTLTDDIILYILGRVDITTATRTSVLSKRWRVLPRLLPELNLRVWDFMPIPRPGPIEAHHMDQGMACLTKATRSFLADPTRKSTSTTNLLLQLYGGRNYSREIGLLVRDAIDSGALKQLELRIVHEKEVPVHCRHEDMVQQARDVIDFFTTYPCVHSCLVSLLLHNVRFTEQDIHHVLFDSCKELKKLMLFHCDVGDCSIWQINAPDSKLAVLEIAITCLERVEVVCLPKLRRLHLDNWLYFEAPLRFGFVPSLNELALIRSGTLDNQEFRLSAVLHGTTNIHTLTLDFEGGELWIQPEGKQLCPAFNNLRELSICGISVDFDLLWTINLLEAAPSVEIFLVQIWDQCREDRQLRTETAYADQRTKPSWSITGFTSSNTWKLKEILFVGFRPLEQQILFIRAVMKRAPNLKALLLKENEKPCRRCEAMATPCPLRGGFFPRDQEEQEATVKQFRDGVCSSARIIFASSHVNVKCAVYS
ncbi:putative F-box/FBD/LRR-repeat protein At4g00315 isoform X1 [Lolium perenne]|uniref:putative F-box/FBD/LRR-repeat protein At4g00315 isoform X1 n=1 Tax=Lolium perenne TaxID=4522 RepID=UPI0021F61994|nr:uncharacterized protein LOC127331880 isoform X1 [Lolium perenne]